MEQIVQQFTKFLPGSHLIIGEAGSGKTRLIWSILQEKDFVEDDSINIVLTDSEKRIWHNPKINPIVTIYPYDTNISWVTEPKNPGIYYCACDYAPRVITFLECLATWAIQNEKGIHNTVRIFVDFPSKYWALPEFVDQLSRLHYIIASQDTEHSAPIEIWAVMGSVKKISPQTKSLFKDVNLVLLNPLSENLKNDIAGLVKSESLPALLAGVDSGLKDGFYYIPHCPEAIYLNAKPIVKL